MGKLRGVGLVVLVLGCTMALTGTAGASGKHLHRFGHVTCRNGTIRAGSYRSLTIAGTCMLTPNGTATVKGNVVVRGNAFLNTLTTGTFNVGGNVVVKNDGIAGLGCNDEVGCPTESNDHIGGNLTGNGAWAVVVEQEHVGGNISIIGGGRSENCASTGLMGGPFFATVHDSTVGGNVVVRGVHTCWFGLIRTQIAGNAKVIGNRFGDPDANEIVTNVVGGNLSCFNNVPGAQVGDSMGLPNIVGGQKRGECKNL
jgi:hypothetical protein